MERLRNRICLTSRISRLSLFSTRLGLPVNYPSLVVCGPSGVGKGTIISQLLKDYPNSFALSVSHTTRPPRAGEINGIHYHFVDKEYMENEITADKGSFLEIARVHHNIYGTSANEISRINEQGKVCVLDVDMAGVMSLKKLNVAGRFIFIKPPSLLVLETRLRERGTENEDQISLRMKNNCEVMKQFEDSNHFDFQVTNDNIEKCYEDIIGQMQSWYSALQLEKVHSP